MMLRLSFGMLSSPKGLCAESARAVTGRQCPHSGEGGDFFLPFGQVFFNEKLHIFAPSGQLETHQSMFSTRKIGIFGHFGRGLAAYFGALLVGWLVVVARGLYLARRLSIL